MHLTTLTLDNSHIRQSLYGGQIYALAANEKSRQLVEWIRTYLCAACNLSHDDIGQIQNHLPIDGLYAHLAGVRSWLQKDASVSMRIHALLTSLGFAPEEFAVDYPRLRVVVPDAFRTPSMDVAYSVHRDTWYGNPQAQINCWLPLHDVSHTQSFAFYPEYFSQNITNSSRLFDFEQWIKTIGWQSTARGVHVEEYPSTLALPDAAKEWHFPLAQASCLLFSGQHLHATQPNRSDEVRFSIDFRFVHRDDKARGIGAENVDNASRGDASLYYNYLDHIMM